MPNTPIYGLTYPERTALGGNFPADLADLAADIDAALGLVAPDSGVVGSLALTPGVGFSVAGNQHRVIGKVLFFNLRFERTGAAIPVNASGNIVGDPIIGTITDAAKRPAMVNWVGFFRAGFTGGGSLIQGGSGNIEITSGHPTSEIATGTDVIVAGRFSIP